MGRVMQLGTVEGLYRYPVKSMGGEALDATEVTVGGLPTDRAYAVRDERAREVRGAKNFPALLGCSARHEGERLVVRMPDGAELGIDDPRLEHALSELVGTPVTVHGLEPAENRDHYRRRMPGSRLGGRLARSPTLARGLQKVMAATRADGELRTLFGRERGEPMPDLSVFPPELFEFVSPPGTYFDAFPIHILTSSTLAALADKHPEGQWDVQRFRPNLFLRTDPALSGLVEGGWAGRKVRVGEVVLSCTVPTPRCSMVLARQPGLDKDPRILRTIVREADQNAGVYANVERPGRIRVGDTATLL